MHFLFVFIIVNCIACLKRYHIHHNNIEFLINFSSSQFASFFCTNFVVFFYYYQKCNQFMKITPKMINNFSFHFFLQKKRKFKCFFWCCDMKFTLCVGNGTTRILILWKNFPSANGRASYNHFDGQKTGLHNKTSISRKNYNPCLYILN